MIGGVGMTVEDWQRLFVLGPHQRLYGAPGRRVVRGDPTPLPAAVAAQGGLLARASWPDGVFCSATHQGQWWWSSVMLPDGYHLPWYPSALELAGTDWWTVHLEGV